MSVQREQVQNTEMLTFGGKPLQAQEPLINYYHNKQAKQVRQPQKLVTFVDASKQKQKNFQQSIQRVRPMTAVQGGSNEDKPTWDGHQVVQAGLFDKAISKNELFKNDRRAKDQKLRQGKENSRDMQQQQKKQEQVSQSFKTLNEIEHLIIKQKDQHTEVQLRKQQKELNELQSMVQQEKQLKQEQDKQFNDKLTKLKQNQSVTNNLGKQLKRGKRNHFQNSNRKATNIIESPYKQKSTPKKSNSKSKQKQKQQVNEFNVSYDDQSDVEADVWKNTLDVIEYQETKREQHALPGQYNDLDQVPSKGRLPQSSEKMRPNVYKQLMPAVSNQDNELLQQQLLDIQKREIKRQVELDVLIKKQENFVKSESKQNQKQYNHLSKKLANIKTSMSPLIKKMDLPESKTLYPFTGHLLARTISKMVQSHSEQLTELLIDEILIEMVGVLNEDEDKKQIVRNQRMQKDTINDFIEAFKDLAHDQDQIEARNNQRLQSQSQSEILQQQNSQDQKYLPLVQLERDQNFFKNTDDRIRYVETSSGFIMRVLENRKKRLNQTRRTSLYAPKNVEVFNNVCKDIMDNLLDDAARHMDKYTDQLAEQIFVNEFK